MSPGSEGVKRILCTLAIIGFGVSVVRGQATLTLEQCIALAREHNPALQIGRYRMESATFAGDELATTRLPQLRLAASPVYAPFGRSFGYDPVLSNGGQIIGQLVLQQSLFDGGIRGLKSDQLALDVERLGREERKTDRDLVFAVTQAFFESLRAKEEVALEAEGVAQLSAYADLVRRLQTGGSAGYTDVLKADLELDGERILFQKAREEYDVSRYALAELIGGPIDTSLSVEGTWDNDPDPRADSLAANTQPDSLGFADLAIADLELRSRMLDVQLAEHERWPVISLAADAGYANSGENLRLPADERFSALGFSLGIVVDLPLITWGATGLRVQQRETAVEMQRLETQQLRRSLITETKKTLLGLTRARERQRALRRSASKAEESFLLTKSRFAGGGGFSFEVLAARQTMRELRLAELRAKADCRILRAKLEQLTNR
jgi:outer membrane protein